MAEQVEAALVFGKYQAIRRIKIGGMGEIFLARQTGVAGFDRIVILKTLLPELAEDPVFVEQFLDEARIAAMLNHPSIVSIYEVGAWQGLYVIAMEYIAGENLGELMQTLAKADVRIPHSITAHIVREAARALDHAHRAADTANNPLNIVHRDVGMQNIMVRDDGVVKVVDFGIARAANRATRTRTGLIKGKLQYMSPEQVRGGDLDGRSDQFSLGIVFWEMLAHRRLFKADNEFLAMQKIAGGEIPLPSSVDSTIPPTIDAIVMRMLQREREDRYPSCRDVADAITAHLAEINETVDERAVAEFVHTKLGFDTGGRTRDLTPTAELFATSGSFRGLVTPLEATVAFAGEQEARRRKKSRRFALGVAAFLVAVLASIATGVWVMQRNSTRLELAARRDAAAQTAAARAAAAASIPAPPAPPPAAVPQPPDKVEPKSGAAGRRQPPRRTRPGPAPQGVVRGDGFLTLNATPWVKVTIDGRPYGSTPIYRLRLAAGAHDVLLINEEAGINERRRVAIAPDENEKLNLDFRGK